MIVTARIVVWLVSGISLDTVLFLKKFTLVGSWAGFEDTNYLGNEVVLRGTNCPRHISQGTVMNFLKTPTNPLLFLVKILQNEQSNRRICRLITNIFHYHENNFPVRT